MRGSISSTNFAYLYDMPENHSHQLFYILVMRYSQFCILYQYTTDLIFIAKAFQHEGLHEKKYSRTGSQPSFPSPQVLQRPVDRELELYSEGKEKGVSLAKVTMVSLSSQPVDTDEPPERAKSFMADNPGRFPSRHLCLRGKNCRKGNKYLKVFFFYDSCVCFCVLIYRKSKMCLRKYCFGRESNKQYLSFWVNGVLVLECGRKEYLKE